MVNKFILLIEDCKDIQESLVWTFEHEGFVIKTADNGKDALVILEQEPLPSLILLDMMMPIMDGWQFREIQKLNPRLCDIPTAIITAKINIEDQIQLRENEVFIPKPFNMNTLFEIVRKHCTNPIIPA